MSLARLAPQSWSREGSQAQATAAVMYRVPETLQTVMLLFHTSTFDFKHVHLILQSKRLQIQWITTGYTGPKQG